MDKVCTLVYTLSIMAKTKDIVGPTFVGLKEFRRDVSKYAKQAQDGARKVVVTSRNKPLFMLTPLNNEIYTAGVLEAVAEARADIAAGRMHTFEEIKAEFGL